MSVVRRVRLELPVLVPSPQKEELEALSYADWLRAHADEMMTLVNDDNQPLLKGIRSITGIVEAFIPIPVGTPKTEQDRIDAAVDAETIPAIIGAVDSIAIDAPTPIVDVAEVPATKVFVTDFCFESDEALDYYNFNYLQVMKGRIVESYPSAMDPDSPFKYRFGIRGIVDSDVFEALGTINSAKIDVVVQVGEMD